MGAYAIFTTKGYIVGAFPALTGGCGFDQCPAPLAGPAHPNLADRASDPR